MLRTESALVRRYENWLVPRGLTLRRYDIRTAEAEQLWADAYDEERRLLVEAKSSGSRTAMRMAVGQLLDYRLSLEHEVRIAVLVPEPPSPSVVRYLSAYRVGLIVEIGDGEFEEALLE